MGIAFFTFHVLRFVLRTQLDHDASELCYHTRMHEPPVTITNEQVALVQASYDKIAPIRATAGALFYRRLFELDPGLRPLFTSDISLQGVKLMAMIELIV